MEDIVNRACAVHQSDFLDPDVNGLLERNSTLVPAHVKTFVKSKKGWHWKQGKDSWVDKLNNSSHADTASQISESGSQRLHMVWFVCGIMKCFPNRFQWNEITEGLHGVAVQLLVTGTTYLVFEEVLKFGQAWISPRGQDEELKELALNATLGDGDHLKLWQSSWNAKRTWIHWNIYSSWSERLNSEACFVIQE